MKSLSIGVDVSQHKLDVATVMGSQIESMGSFKNDACDFPALVSAIEDQKRKQMAETVLIVIEPTGGYEQAFARFALDLGFLVALPNPRQVRHWATGVGIRAKTDSVDAAMLARYGASTHPPPWNPPQKEIEILDAMLARRWDLEAMVRAEQNRLAAERRRPVACPKALESIQQSIEFLTSQIQSLSESIDQHFKTHNDLKKQSDCLQSIPGVGKKNVQFLLVALHRFAAKTNGEGKAKSLVAHTGLDPVPYQSGTSVLRPARISKQGNSQLRHYLFLGALGGKRGNNPLATFYQRLVGRGKRKMVALIACARKILVWSWAIFLQDTPFDPEKATP